MTSRRAILVAICLLASTALATSPATAAGASCMGSKATIEGTGIGEPIQGTDGPDIIAGGGGNDVIHGNGGNDQICGDEGDDTIYGGTNMDLIYPGTGDDDVHGGALNEEDDNISDQMTYLFASPAVHGVEINVATGAADDKGAGTFIGNDTFEGIEILGGTEHDDTLSGSDDTDDYFAGYLGDDDIDGKGGIDAVSHQLSQGGVNVFLEGGTSTGEGDDTLASMEYIIGSEFTDFLVGSDEPNVIFGGDGHDYIWGRGGNDPIVGQEGQDHLFGGAGTIDWLVHEDRPANSVNVDLTHGTVTHEGSPPPETCLVQTPPVNCEVDQVFGFELTSGSQEADKLTGNNGTNYFIADAGADEIDGGGGGDLVAYFRATNGINADLGAGGVNVTGLGQDQVRNVEDMTGTVYADVLRGTSGPNYINGLDGNDKIFSEGGADYLIAGKGKDKIDGGQGPEDLLDFLNATQKITADLQDGTARGEGSDTLVALEQLGGSVKGDVLRGNGGANKLLGNSGNDKLFGRGGNDAINGQNGNDQIDGAGGKDVCKEKSESRKCESYKTPKDHPLIEVSRRYKRLEDLDRRYKRRYK